MIKFLILILLILLLVSCSEKVKKESEFYIETKTSFFDLRHSDWTKNKWIRDPENLKIVHESFKKFGYRGLKHLIFKSDNEFIIQDIYIKKNFEILFDSLELTYNNPKTISKYYVEFWNRRKKEKNDSIVYEIIQEINELKSLNERMTFDEHYVNDTLVNLLSVEFSNIPLVSQKQQKDFKILLNYGLHQSAYNLLYERPEYHDLKSESENLKKLLIKSNVYTHPWIIDLEK